MYPICQKCFQNVVLPSIDHNNIYKISLFNDIHSKALFTYSYYKLSSLKTEINNYKINILHKHTFFFFFLESKTKNGRFINLPAISPKKIKLRKLHKEKKILLT